MRPMTLVRTGLVLGLVSLVGCQSARFVEVRSDGSGVVAIPENSNTWPFYYRDKAEALIRQKCPHGYSIEHESEVVTGTVTHTDSQTNTQQNPTLLVGGTSGQAQRNGSRDSNSGSFGALAIPGQTEQSTEETTTSRNVTEWQIVYRAK
jgi:hypothetical protein